KESAELTQFIRALLAAVGTDARTASSFVQEWGPSGPYQQICDALPATKSAQDFARELQSAIPPEGGPEWKQARAALDAYLSPENVFVRTRRTILIEEPAKFFESKDWKQATP